MIDLEDYKLRIVIPKEDNKQIVFALKLKIKVEDVKEMGIKIFFEEEIHEVFKSAFYLGIDYFQSKNRNLNHGLNVHILEFNYIPIDTTPMVVFYGIVDFLNKKYNCENKDFRIDETGNFIIPK